MRCFDRIAERRGINLRWKAALLLLTLYCLLPSAYCFAQTPTPAPQSNVTITRAPGSESSLILTTPDTQGNLLSLRVPDAARPGHFVQVPLVNTGGHIGLPGSITISGHYTSGIGSDGVKYIYIKPSSVTPPMLDIFADTMVGINVRANQQAGAFVINAMDSDGSTTFTLEANGDHVWGRVLAKQWDQRPMGDTRLGRTAPGVLSTPGELQAVKVTVGGVSFTSGEGKPQGSCQTGLYYQTDDGGRLFVCRAHRWMRAMLKL